MSERLSTVADVLPSAWWRNAEVIVLDCGHRHIRPKGYAPPKGSPWPCCFCDPTAAAIEGEWYSDAPKP